MKTWMHILAVLSLLLSSLSVREPTPTPGVDPAPTATQEAPTPTATIEPNPYPLPGTETPAPVEPTAIPTPEEDRPAPTPIPEEPSVDSPLGITASANPAIYIPGKPVYVLWAIDGYSQLAAGAKAFIRLYTIDLSSEAGAEKAAGEMLLPVSENRGVTEWKVAENTQFPLYLSLELLVDDQLIDTEVLEISAADFELSSREDSAAATSGGKVRISASASSLAENTAFSVRTPSPNRMPAISLSGNPIEIIAVGSESGRNISQFKEPIQIQVRYDQDEIFDWNPEDLLLFYYDEKTTDWNPLETAVDTENQLLTAYSDHLTVFDFKASSWQAASLPSLDSFQVSDFSGAATYAYSFWTPPGVGELSPNLSLVYNSQVIDEATAYTQASWVGMGWSLETGAITRNMHETNSNLNDDTFTISVNGISDRLLPTGTTNPYLYHTSNESFLKVQFDSSTNTWTAWDKDGTKYTFNQPLRTAKNVGCEPNAQQLDLTWKWSLGTVTDKYGNSLVYGYDKDLKGGNCLNEIADYPVSITYPNNRYRVRFILESRSDYQNSWKQDVARTLFSKRRLKEIRVEHAPSGNWASPTLLRKYVFGYAADTATSNVIYPNLTWSAGGRTLTLLSLQEFSGDGSLSLPATTFYYGDENGDGVDEAMHLTQVENGYGGKVQIRYERWSYFDNLNDSLRSLKTEFGTNGQECTTDQNDHSWYSALNYVGCNNTIHYLQIGTTGVPGIGKHSIPEHVVKPGSLYRFDLKARAFIAPANVSWGFKNTTSGIERMLTNVLPGTDVELSGTLEMPASFNPFTTELRIGGNGALIGELNFRLYPQYRRVVSKTFTDLATNQSTTYTYRYDNASPNSASVSAAIAAGGNCSSVPTPASAYTCALREFRGHAVTQVTDPSGLSEVIWYWQSDALKGRPYHTLSVKEDLASAFEQSLSATPGWASTGVISTTVGVFDQQMQAGVDFDYALKAQNDNPTRNVEVSRSTASLSDGDTAVAQFRLSGAEGQGEVGIASDGGKFFGIVLQLANGKTEARLRYDYGGNVQNGALLIDGDHFKLDRWYVVALSVDNDRGFQVRLWQLDDPSVHGEASLGGYAADNWRFRQRVYKGTLWLDDYFEGVVYRETETQYASETFYDTTQGNGIDDLPYLLAYKDLAVVWSYPVETISRTYASNASLNSGDTDWTGTRTTYQYETADQHFLLDNGYYTGKQYGNLTRTVTSTWNGTSWTPVRATKSEFWMRDSVNAYLVGLPGRIMQVDCSSACDLNTGNPLLGESLYIYEGSDSYSSAPFSGRLRFQRDLVDTNDGKRYSETAFTYDSYGNILTQKVYTGYATDINSPTSGQQTITFTYDSSYRSYPLSQKNALNQLASTSYDYALGLPVSETDANGAVTTASYDALGRITALVRPGDDAANPTMVFSYHIDSAYHLFWTEAQQCRGSADQSLNPTCDGQYTKIRKYYNWLGQLLQTQQDAEVAGTLKTVVTNYYYDAMGRLSKQAVPFSVALTNGAFASRPASPSTFTQTSYDLLGRVIEARAPDGTIQTNVYTIQREGSVPYNVVRTTDSRNNSTYTWSDALGRTRKVVPASGPGVTYTYNAADRLVSVQYGAYTTSLFYDIAGRKLTMSDPDMGSWNYVYDALGNLTQQTDARGCITNLVYDALNRLVGKTYSNKTGGNCSTIAANTPPVSYTYDQGTNGKGRRTGMVDGSGSTSWQYDGRGRMQSETAAITGVGTYTTKWGYDSADRVASMVYPSGETVYTTYNAQGLAISLDSTMWLSYASQVKYDEAGRPLERTLGNGVKNSRVYYPWSAQGGRLQSISSVTGTTPAITRQNLSYGYDANGNVTSMQDTVAGESLTYTYDSMNRLTGVSGAYSESYTYNSTTGNLASKGGQTLTYGASNHPHAATSMGSNTYTYDLNGNMLTRKISGVTYTLGYDAEGRLVSISGGGMSASYTYNGDGERVKTAITVSGATKTTAYVGDYFEVSLGTAASTPPPVTQNCVTSKCAFLPFVTTSMANLTAGQAWTSYYSLGGQRIAIRVQSRQVGVAEGTYYPLSDQLGSTTVTLDASANRFGELRYKAWGQTRYTYGTTPTQRRYTGQLEAEASLYFYNARWYDSALGRFAQADTKVPESQGVQAYNRYSYVNNNPLKYTDPSGHEVCDEEGHCYNKGEYRKINGQTTLEWWAMSFGIIFSGDRWSRENQRSVINAVRIAGEKFASIMGSGITAWRAFREVFGNTFTFRWSNTTPGNAGQTNTKNDITLYAVENNPYYFQGHSRVIIHEIGHAFNLATGRAAEVALPANLLRDTNGIHVDRYIQYYGFSGGWDDWQFGWDNNRSEVIADMFIGWTYNSWDLQHQENLGLLRQAHMNSYMENWLDP